MNASEPSSPAPFLLVTNSSACGDDVNLGDIPRLAAGRPFAVVTLNSWKYILGEYPKLKALYPTAGVATAPLCIFRREPKLVVNRLHTIVGNESKGVSLSEEDVLDVVEEALQ